MVAGWRLSCPSPLLVAASSSPAPQETWAASSPGCSSRAGPAVVGVVRKAAEAGTPAGLDAETAARYRAHVTELSDEAGVAAAFDLAASLAPVWGLVNAAGAWWVG